VAHPRLQRAVAVEHRLLVGIPTILRHMQAATAVLVRHRLFLAVR